jgi:alkylation response protein AidB-like acyl-CoA dehydrogenase
MENAATKSRQLAEEAREADWKRESFLRELFEGSFRADLVFPIGREEPAERPEFSNFYQELKSVLIERVDPVAIDETGEYPKEVIAGLAEIGAFGMKIAPEYGGLGLTPREYERAIELVGSYDANVTALLSAHQSIGVPQPLALFGSDVQKRKYLPRCAAGAISGFALTEPGVGSDPARMVTVAVPTPDGKAFILNGTKLWCTNGTLAELLVVMAKTAPGGGISAFIVETGWKGVSVRHRCRFMGLKALANAELSFENVVVPRENLIGAEGRGLKIALVTLNTGRLSLPAATTGGAKALLEICRVWSNARVQWGQPIGKHEAIAHKLADMAASTFAMESVADLAAALAERKDYDIRLEAAAAKEWNTVRGWQLVDDALEIRGGRGFETERSLEARGEVPIGIERMMRDARVNRIFEGSSEIMHLFMAREAVDKHLRLLGGLLDPKKSIGAKVLTGLRALGFYAVWYPTRWLSWTRWPRFRSFGPLARHLRFAARASRKLSRAIFHGMVRHGGGLERRQAFLFRVVDVAIEIFVMTASVGRARRLAEQGHPAADEARRLADLACRESRDTIRARFASLFHNHDAFKYAVGRRVLEGAVRWLETGIIGLGRTVKELIPGTTMKARDYSSPFLASSSV